MKATRAGQITAAWHSVNAPFCSVHVVDHIAKPSSANEIFSATCQNQNVSLVGEVVGSRDDYDCSGK